MLLKYVMLWHPSVSGAAQALRGGGRVEVKVAEGAARGVGRALRGRIVAGEERGPRGHRARRSYDRHEPVAYDSQLVTRSA